MNRFRIITNKRYFGVTAINSQHAYDEAKEKLEKNEKLLMLIDLGYDPLPNIG